MIVEYRFPLPPTLNEQIDFARSGWMVSAKQKKIWTNKICQFVKELDYQSFPDTVWLEFHWYLTNFGRDQDNVAASAKYIMDGLVASAVLRSDNLMITQSPVVHYYHRAKANEVFLRISDSPNFLLDNFLASHQFEQDILLNSLPQISSELILQRLLLKNQLQNKINGHERVNFR